MPITLVLTRQPDLIVAHPSGLTKDDPKRLQFVIEEARFGTLLIFEGAKVTKASLTKWANTKAGDSFDEMAAGSITLPGGWLTLTSAGDVKEIRRYTTMERFDHGMVSLLRKDEPYGVYWVEYNSTVAKLGPTNGNCFGLTGAEDPKRRNILFHAAPKVPWLTGCISPRKLGDHKVYTETTYAAIQDMHQVLKDDRVDLYVTDS